MSSTYINGENIIFTSRSSNNVITLRPENGKTLAIENVSVAAAGNNREIQFNDLGSFGSSTNLKYSTLGVLSTPSIDYGVHYGSDFHYFNNSAAQAIPNDTTTLIAGSHWTTGADFVGALVPSGITRNSGTFTIVRDGVFSINATVVFIANATGIRRLILTRDSLVDTIRYAESSTNACTSGTTALNLSATVRAVAGSVFKLFVYQNSTADLDVEGAINSGITRFFSINRIADL
jgi:hypothetical protein